MLYWRVKYSLLYLSYITQSKKYLKYIKFSFFGEYLLSYYHYSKIGLHSPIELLQRVIQYFGYCDPPFGLRLYRL
jgi:hypothetical protein